MMPTQNMLARAAYRPEQAAEQEEAATTDQVAQFFLRLETARDQPGPVRAIAGMSRMLARRVQALESSLEAFPQALQKHARLTDDKFQKLVAELRGLLGEQPEAPEPAAPSAPPPPPPLEPQPQLSPAPPQEPPAAALTSPDPTPTARPAAGRRRNPEGSK